MTAGQWWHHLSVWAARQGQPPSHVPVLGTGLLAAAAVASRRLWPVARTVVTIARRGLFSDHGPREERLTPS
jgi:hypothetical protein